MCSDLQSVQISGFCIWNVSKLPGIYLHLVPKLWRKMINRPAARKPINKPGFTEKQPGFFASVQVVHCLEYVGVWCAVCVWYAVRYMYIFCVPCGLCAQCGMCPVREVHGFCGYGIYFVYVYGVLPWYSSRTWKPFS